MKLSFYKNYTRHFFTLNTQKCFSESRLVGYSPEQMYLLVSNINDYALFVPYCNYSKIISHQSPLSTHQKSIHLKAELGVGFQTLFSEKYLSDVICIPFQSVEASLSFKK